MEYSIFQSLSTPSSYTKFPDRSVLFLTQPGVTNTKNIHTINRKDAAGEGIENNEKIEIQKHVGCIRHLTVDTRRKEFKESKKVSNMSRNPLACHGVEYQEDRQGQKYSERLNLTSNSRRPELKESKRVMSISRDAAKRRRTEYRRISVERKNRSYDESCSKHTCSLAMDMENHKHSCYTGRTKNRDNRNVKLYMDDTSLLYGAKLHRQFSLQ